VEHVEDDVPESEREEGKNGPKNRSEKEPTREMVARPVIAPSAVAGLTERLGKERPPESGEKSECRKECPRVDEGDTSWLEAWLYKESVRGGEDERTAKEKTGPCDPEEARRNERKNAGPAATRVAVKEKVESVV
jgi:hypothetical protein